MKTDRQIAISEGQGYRFALDGDKEETVRTFRIVHRQTVTHEWVEEVTAKSLEEAIDKAGEAAYDRSPNQKIHVGPLEYYDFKEIED